METAKLRIVTDTPPPAIMAQIPLESHSSTEDLIAVAVPVRPGRHLDVDGILARSLPKVTETLERTA